MKKIGVVICIICILAAAYSVVGIVTANQGRVESITPEQLAALNRISGMDIPALPEGETVDPTVNHPKSDSLVQLVLKKTDDTLTGRLRLLEGIATKYLSVEAQLIQIEGFRENTPEFDAEIEKCYTEEMDTRFTEEAVSYAVYSQQTNLTVWEKFCLFAVTYRSVLLVFGFLGLSFGIAIASSGTFKSDMDESP